MASSRRYNRARMLSTALSHQTSACYRSASYCCATSPAKSADLVGPYTSSPLPKQQGNYLNTTRKGW